MQDQIGLLLRGHDVKVANKVLAEKLCVVCDERALIRVLFLYGKEHSYFLFLQRSRVLVRVEYACLAPHGAGWYRIAPSSATSPCAMAYERWFVGKSMLVTPSDSGSSP